MNVSMFSVFFSNVLIGVQGGSCQETVLAMQGPWYHDLETTFWPFCCNA